MIAAVIGPVTKIGHPFAIEIEFDHHLRQSRNRGIPLSIEVLIIDNQAREDALKLLKRAIADGSWHRLKACPNEECTWVFYDASKNRSAKWCAMARCGDRMKARAYRRRRRDRGAARRRR